MTLLFLFALVVYKLSNKSPSFVKEGGGAYKSGINLIDIRRPWKKNPLNLFPEG
jgi:hypothetical protein